MPFSMRPSSKSPSVCVLVHRPSSYLMGSCFFFKHICCVPFFSLKKKKHILEIVLHQYMGTLTLLLRSWLFMASHFMAPSQFT